MFTLFEQKRNGFKLTENVESEKKSHKKKIPISPYISKHLNTLYSVNKKIVIKVIRDHFKLGSKDNDWSGVINEISKKI